MAGRSRKPPEPNYSELIKLRKKWSIGEVKIKYKREMTTNVTIDSTVEAATVAYHLFDKDSFDYNEQFAAIFLDRANHVIAYRVVGVGSAHSVTIDVPQILTLALLTRASSVVLAHNHPSGNTKPSMADFKVTRELNTALRAITLKLIDHVIITRSGFFSFANIGEIK